MTLQQLYYALTIAKMGSMNKAAEALYISQPSLTAAIKELEKETGLSIFLRTGRGVVPTAEGEAFLTQARQVHQQYELLLEKYGSYERGSLKRRFGVSTQHYSFAVKAFVEMVKKFDILKYEFAIRETRTYEVIHDVGTLKSEIGILYLSDLNRKIIGKLLLEYDLEFHWLINCQAYVYLWRKHPLAGKQSITMSELADYPCLSFEQGKNSSVYFAEEILSENEYPRTVKTNDRATMLNLMVGLLGYTLCSGIICEELNGSDYVAVPFCADDANQNSQMEIGYVTKRHAPLSRLGEVYIQEMKKYLQIEDQTAE